MSVFMFLLKSDLRSAKSAVKNATNSIADSLRRLCLVLAGVEWVAAAKLFTESRPESWRRRWRLAEWRLRSLGETVIGGGGCWGRCWLGLGGRSVSSSSMSSSSLHCRGKICITSGSCFAVVVVTLCSRDAIVVH